MTTSVRAKLVYAALFIPLCLVLLPFADNSSPPSWAIIVAVALVAAMFLAPSLLLRCPHCGKRQVGLDLWGYFFVGERCRYCVKLLDGPPISEEDNAFQVLEETDPAEAARLKQLVAEQKRLKQQALSSRDAAAAYRYELLRQRVDALALLRDWEAGRLQDAPSDLIDDARKKLKQLESELAHVSEWLSQAT